MLSLYLFTTLFTNFLLITKKWLCYVHKLLLIYFPQINLKNQMKLVMMTLMKMVMMTRRNVMVLAFLHSYLYLRLPDVPTDADSGVPF